MANVFLKNTVLLKLLLSALLFNTDLVLSEKKHPCALIWTQFAAGSSIPDIALNSQKDQLYVIRGRIADGGDLTVGFYDPTEERSFISDIANPNSNTSVHTLMTFDLLTNPNNCETNWLDKRHEDVSKFAVSCNEGSVCLVGRAVGNTSLLNGNRLFSGHIVSALGTILIPQLNSTIQRTDYSVLTSFTTDVTLSLVDFKFAEDVFGGPSSIIGMDEIINDSPAEISQTVTHRRSLSSRMKFSSRVGFTVGKTTNMKSGWDLGLIGNSGSSSNYEGTTTTNDTSFEREETSEFRVSRTINVSPFSSVQACTLMQIRENFETTWTATATFISPGVQPELIVNWLKTEDGWKDLTFQIENDIVKTEISGEFQGSFAVNSKFFVSSNGCSETSKFLAHQKRNNILDFKEEERQILNIMKSRH